MMLLENAYGVEVLSLRVIVGGFLKMMFGAVRNV